MNMAAGNCISRNKQKLRIIHRRGAVSEVSFGTPSAIYSASMMIRLTFLALSVVLAGTVSAQSNSAGSSAGSQEQPKTDPQPKPEAKGTPSALTGCLDEQDGKWVLVNAQTMAVIANLAADGFPAEGFAKHMGQKITVRGTGSPAGSPPLFKVRSVEIISETCAAR